MKRGGMTTMNVNERKTVRFRSNVTLTALLRLPAEGRRRRGQNMTCDACGRQIDDEFFLGGFATGHKNMLLHESCVPEADKARLLKTEARHAAE